MHGTASLAALAAQCAYMCLWLQVWHCQEQQSCPVHSSAPIAADFYMSLYNVVFSALVPLIVGTMDVDVSKELSRKYPGRFGRSLDNKSVVQHLAQRQTCRPCCPLFWHY